MRVPKTCLFLDLAENGEEGWLHPMCVDVALPCVLETEVVHAEDLVEDVLDVDTTTSVICSIGEATLLPHEVGQGVVSVCGVPELPVFTLFWRYFLPL